MTITLRIDSEDLETIIAGLNCVSGNEDFEDECALLADDLHMALVTQLHANGLEEED